MGNHCGGGWPTHEVCPTIAPLCLSSRCINPIQVYSIPKDDTIVTHKVCPLSIWCTAFLYIGDTRIKLAECAGTGDTFYGSA